MPRPRRRYSPAEAVADRLRERILSGGMSDLPKLEELTAEFGMTRSTVRDACRILETEGLLTVRRGTGGGGVAHAPSPETAAYTIGLVLQSQDVAIPDVQAAVHRFEPLCVELCAERPDREATVLPALEAVQQELLRAIDDGDMEGASAAARNWHKVLVSQCGNTTSAVIVGTLEAVWSAHVRQVGREHHARGVSLDPAMSRAAYDEHEHIQALIRAGDGQAAAAAAQRHLEEAHTYTPNAEGDAVVRAVSIRDAFFT